MNGNGTGIDPAKIFIVGMSILVVGLGVGILLTLSSVRAYERAYRESKDGLYRRLVERVETAKAFREKEREGETIDLENPIGYINTKAKAANVFGSFDYLPDEKLQVRKGYVDKTFKLSFKQDVSRRDLATFLYNIEKGSSILKVAAIDLRRYRKTAERDEDLWRPVVTLAYRKAYVKPKKK